MPSNHVRQQLKLKKATKVLYFLSQPSSKQYDYRILVSIVFSLLVSLVPTFMRPAFDFSIMCRWSTFSRWVNCSKYEVGCPTAVSFFLSSKIAALLLQVQYALLTCILNWLPSTVFPSSHAGHSPRYFAILKAVQKLSMLPFGFLLNMD